MKSGHTTRAYHEWSSNRVGPVTLRPPRPSGYKKLDPDSQPTVFKCYPQAPFFSLPSEPPMSDVSATDILADRGERSPAPFDIQMLARLLYYSLGVIPSPRKGREPVYKRAAPSAGNRHPVEAYAIIGDLGGLGSGVYHFAAYLNGLECLLPGDFRAVIEDVTAALPGGPAAEAFLVLCGVPWRTAWKYAERGWRHLYWDAGTIISNLLAVAGSQGMSVQLRFAFQDANVCQLLGIDGRDEFPLVVVELGTADTTPGGPIPSSSTRIMQSEGAPARAIEFPLITAVQYAGAFHGAHEVRSWRIQHADRAQLGYTDVPVLSPGITQAIEAVILRHKTSRVMSPESIPHESLAWMMACATRHIPMDAMPLGDTSLTYFLSVHAVDALAPGFYLYRGGTFHPQRILSARKARSLAAHLCLDQEVAGKAAYTLFVCTDLDALLDSRGDRGYRVAQTEAGIVVGRLQLAASVIGYGGSGLTFFEEEVSSAFLTDAACLLACAIGVPAGNI